MDISKYDKVDVLRVLYNHAGPQGIGFLHYTPEAMSKEEARKWFNTGPRFDYLNGRVMKIDLSGDELETYLYNRDNGLDAAEKAIASLNTCIQADKPKRMIRPEVPYEKKKEIL